MDTAFDHENLDVYQLTLQFLSWADILLKEIRNEEGSASVRDHLDRASLSILLNIAEGNGKRRQQIRAKFFDDARGSGTECAACLDAVVAKGFCKTERVQEGKAMLVRIVSMLCKLVDRFSGDNLLKEDEPEMLDGSIGMEEKQIPME